MKLGGTDGELGQNKDILLVEVIRKGGGGSIHSIRLRSLFSYQKK